MSRPAIVIEIPRRQSIGVAYDVHHWRIEEANGPTSLGVCSVCNESREFRNSLEEADFTTRAEREMANSAIW